MDEYVNSSTNPPNKSIYRVSVKKQRLHDIRQMWWDRPQGLQYLTTWREAPATLSSADTSSDRFICLAPCHFLVYWWGRIYYWGRMTRERVTTFTGSIRGTIFTNFCVAPNHVAYKKGSLSDITLRAPEMETENRNHTFLFCKHYVAQVGCWERRQQTHLCLGLLGNLLQRTSRRSAQGFFWQERVTQHCCDHDIILC